ncbi:MFS transporter [Holophaga foetida]|uniref:MFS transporter n=1 Tax=Holophaga foetida TaxID=35839 RepID=UPI0002473F12|nr:MFS transporter [Holophaga foetida]
MATELAPSHDPEVSPIRWSLLALTSVGAFMAPLDVSIVSVAIPKMVPALGMSFGASLWIHASYLLAMAVMLIPMGRLADERGRVHYYLGGVAVFTVGSLGAALSPDGTILILSRLVQGAGAALLSATSAAIIATAFPPQERGKAVGINIMAIYLGLSLGPPLGGFLVDNFGWTWIFLINIPIGLGVFAWGWHLLPRQEGNRTHDFSMDLPGAALLGALLICLLVPFTFAPEWGWHRPIVWILLALALVSGIGFYLREHHAKSPMLDLNLLRKNRLFAAANVAALLNYMALFAVAMLSAVQLQLVHGLSARRTGLIMLSQPVVQAILSPIAGRLSDRIGSRILATLGMVLTALGMVSLALAAHSASLPGMVAALAVVGVGMASFSAPNTSAILGCVPKNQMGLASAFTATMRVTGQALSIAILGSIASSHLAHGGWRQLLKVGSSPQAAAAYSHGYQTAMVVGALFALVGVWASLARGGHTE